MYRVLFFFTLLFVLIVNVYSGQAKVTVDGVTLEIPAGWIFENTSSPPIVFRMLVPQTNQNDIFLNNITLTVEDISNGRTIKDIYNEGLIQIPQLFPGCRSVEKSVESTEKLWHKFEYTNNEGIRLKAKQIIIKKGNTAYVLTYTATRESFDTISFHFERIINSVKISND
jgi:hypothetical protein